jgi:hypothetical protein
MEPQPALRAPFSLARRRAGDEVKFFIAGVRGHKMSILKEHPFTFEDSAN